ncbi:MAG: hypothetical protein DRQ46_00315 [Gammaproteobacteria bacterium]|nr:MAG: hypothetical protein DRQ46_00315 [Gammaproteobacteria bacterium]
MIVTALKDFERMQNDVRVKISKGSHFDIRQRPELEKLLKEKKIKAGKIKLKAVLPMGSEKTKGDLIYDNNKEIIKETADLLGMPANSVYAMLMNYIAPKPNSGDDKLTIEHALLKVKDRYKVLTEAEHVMLISFDFNENPSKIEKQIKSLMKQRKVSFILGCHLARKVLKGVPLESDPDSEELEEGDLVKTMFNGKNFDGKIIVLLKDNRAKVELFGDSASFRVIELFDLNFVSRSSIEVADKDKDQ